MSTVNVMAREMAAKIVFYGPGLSGKTTTLKRIYESVKPSLRGELMSLPTEADRTLFFDFLPVRVEQVGDYSLRLALYTVPGQVFYNATRKLVLQGADGVVFVADSNPGRDDANRESMANLEENLAEQGIRLESFPLVVAYNKRDLPHAASLAEMRQQLNPRAVPDFETCATSGEGVLEVMKAMMRLVLKDLRARKVVPGPRHRTEEASAPVSPEARTSLEDQIRQHIDAAPPEAPRSATPRVWPGVASALAPPALLDVARAAEAAFAASNWDACFRATQDGLRQALHYAGEGPPGAQAHLLGVHGRDVLALLRKTGPARVDDAAFGLYVLMQAFVRLVEAGLPSPVE